jgi:hypothetical protein
MAHADDEPAFENIADPDLPFVTVGQARRIRSQVRTAFAENGLEVRVLGDHVRDDRGRVFGLWNIASACGSDPGGQETWPRVVRAHVRGLLAAIDRDIFAGLNGAEVRARTYARLYPAGQVSPEFFGYATEAMPGLVEVLAFDLPDTVTMMRESDVERFGGLRAMREAGLANLRAVPIEKPERVTTEDGATFDLVTGQSVYTASLALILHDVLGRLDDAVPGLHGVLACVPACRQLAVHVIRDMFVLPSLHLMARFAINLYDSAVGPLSPSVYWWRDGTWEAVSRPGLDGEVRIVLSEDLRRVLDELVA